VEQLMKARTAIHPMVPASVIALRRYSADTFVADLLAGVKGAPCCSAARLRSRRS
jgi:hypothetical protein